VAGPAISHDDNVFTANTNGVLLTHRDAPVHYYKYDSNVVSNVALLNGAFHVVTANQSATVLHVHTLAGQDADTAVPLSSARPTGNVTVLANPSSTGVYVHFDATLYHVVFGKVQSNFTLPAPVQRACIALNRDASILVLSTPTASYGLDPQTTKVMWTLPMLPSAGCPLVFDNTAVFYNASSFTLVDITVGLVAVTLPQTNGCVGQAAFATNCWLVCPTSELTVAAFDANTHTTKWTVDLGSPITAVVTDNSTAVIALSTSSDTQTVKVTSLDVNTGTPRWATRLPGRGGSIGLDKHGGVILFTLGSTQSYVYGFGACAALCACVYACACVRVCVVGERGEPDCSLNTDPFPFFLLTARAARRRHPVSCVSSSLLPRRESERSPAFFFSVVAWFVRADNFGFVASMARVSPRVEGTKTYMSS
jgi:outer membrane protein assembly factor BamB